MADAIWLNIAEFLHWCELLRFYSACSAYLFILHFFVYLMCIFKALYIDNYISKLLLFLCLPSAHTSVFVECLLDVLAYTGSTQYSVLAQY